MRIGVDIDGVLADSLPLWVQELNHFFNKNKQIKDVCLYDIAKSFDLTPEEVETFAAQRGRFIMSAPAPMKDAAHYLKMLKKQHSIYIITARSEMYRTETEGWLRRHGMLYDELLLVGKHEKDEAALETGLQLMIEDTLEIALRLSALGIPVFLLDAPHNQMALPELICRKYSWLEIYETLFTDAWQPLTGCLSGNNNMQVVISPAD